MGLVSVRLMPDGCLVRECLGVVETLVPRVERTTEAEIAAQEDEAEAKAAAAAYARRVRPRTGLTQAAFAARIGVPLDTVRNWEQGKRAPAGPARALLRSLEPGAGGGAGGDTVSGLRTEVESISKCCPHNFPTHRLTEGAATLTLVPALAIDLAASFV